MEEYDIISLLYFIITIEVYMAINNKISDSLPGFFPFWNKMPKQDQEILVNGTNTKKYVKGENIHGGGIHCTGVICIKSGRLRVYLLSPEGKEVTLFRLLEHDVCMLSASCMIKNIAFEVYVDAEVDTEIVLISPIAFEDVGKRNSFVINYIQEMISMRFSESMWVMEQILFMNMDRRLAIFLLEQSNLEESDEIKLTHQEIADHMATAREVISRMLKYFSNEGIVKVSRKGIEIIDKLKLVEKAE